MAVRVRQRTDRPGWYVIIDHNMKRKKKAFPDKETAVRFARTIRERLAEGDFGITKEQPDTKPFSTYYKTWLDSYVRTHTKTATYANYEMAYRIHLLPFLGDTNITEITREQLKRFMYEKLNAGLSRNSVKGDLAPLSEMFNHAIEDRHLNRNPCIRIMRTTREEKGNSNKRSIF